MSFFRIDIFFIYLYFYIDNKHDIYHLLIIICGDLYFSLFYFSLHRIYGPYNSNLDN